MAKLRFPTDLDRWKLGFDLFYCDAFAECPAGYYPQKIDDREEYMEDYDIFVPKLEDDKRAIDIAYSLGYRLDIYNRVIGYANWKVKKFKKLF